MAIVVEKLLRVFIQIVLIIRIKDHELAVGVIEYPTQIDILEL